MSEIQWEFVYLDVVEVKTGLTYTQNNGYNNIFMP